MSLIDWTPHLGILRCPHTKESLSLLTAQEISAVNGLIADRKKTHVDNSKVENILLDKALINDSKTHIYRLEDGIAWLLPVLAIVDAGGQNDLKLSAESEQVRKFYDDFGWLKNDSGHYHDAASFTSTRSTAQQYTDKCNTRISAQLRRGKYLLDAASGPVPSKSYEDLSRGYEFRICVDFSQLALSEAKRNIGQHGLFILGTLTNLPLADGAVDDAISLHTIYHIPQAQQTTAVNELVRVVKAGGRAIVVYTWCDSPLMNAILRLTMFVGAARRGFKTPSRSNSGPQSTEPPRLYIAARGREWFREIKTIHQTAILKLWSATSPSFHHAFFRDTLFGKIASLIVYRGEKLFEPITARFGQYPMIVIRKN